MKKSIPKNRPGFTVVELLVTLAIISVLLSIGALFMITFEGTERSHTGAARLQQWLQIARQRALLDRAPRGVRLFRDPADNRYLVKAQYIELPEDFTGGKAQSNPADNTNTQIILSGVDLTGGQGPNQALWPVQKGDYFQANGAGLMHQILDMTLDTTNNTWTLQLASPRAYAITTATSNYRIVRQPRSLGDETPVMPFEVAIDTSANTRYGKPLPFNLDGTLDILFSPDGQVLGNIVSDRMIFWVRQYGDTDLFRGDPSLIVVFTRSGLVESYPVDKRNQTNPFSKIQ